jgi:hypothetical protein
VTAEAGKDEKIVSNRSSQKKRGAEGCTDIRIGLGLLLHRMACVVGGCDGVRKMRIGEAEESMVRHLRT